MVRLAGDKHFSLFQKIVNCGQKSFIMLTPDFRKPQTWISSSTWRPLPFPVGVSGTGYPVRKDPENRGSDRHRCHSILDRKNESLLASNIATSLSIMMLSITTPSIMTLSVWHSAYDIQQNDTQYMTFIIMTLSKTTLIIIMNCKFKIICTKVW